MSAFLTAGVERVRGLGRARQVGGGGGSGSLKRMHVCERGRACEKESGRVNARKRMREGARGRGRRKRESVRKRERERESWRKGERER